MHKEVLLFGAIYTVLAIVSKVIGCGGPALLLGFNGKGALRIGTGMVPRGEVALIVAGIGMSTGVLSNELFAVIIFMTFITTLAAPPLLNLTLKIKGSGTRKEVKGEDTVSATWEFSSDEIAYLVSDSLRKDLRDEGFFVQVMNHDVGLCQVRKGDISISIIVEESVITIETSREDMNFVKTAVYEVILALDDTIEKLKASYDPVLMKKDLMDGEARTRSDLLSLIDPGLISMNLQGETKDEVITELVDLLYSKGKILYREKALEDVLDRERSMSTGMENGIALPHAKTDGVADIHVAVGVKKSGVDFGSLDGEPSRLFIMVVSPRKVSGPHIQFLAAIAAVLRDEKRREEIIDGGSPENTARLLRQKI
jgi:mannitol/fructose-specific phosphotransferase system IIA component (Ntr-type)